MFIARIYGVYVFGSMVFNNWSGWVYGDVGIIEYGDVWCFFSGLDLA